jgi:ribosomal protein S18 acetylase RimI-like enzyme
MEPVYGIEDLKKTLADPRLRDLILEQHEELTVFRGLPVSINAGWMLELEAKGAFKVFSVRVGKQLVGYVPFYLMPHPHHSTSIVATVDNFYLDPAYRSGTGIGLEMFRRAFTAMEECGARAIVIHRKNHKAAVGSDIGKFFERLGFEPIEILYARSIGGLGPCPAA